MKIFNIFKKSFLVKVVDKEFNVVKENIKIKKIPVVGEKIYFDENIVYVVVDIIHYIGKHQTIWLIVNEQSEENSVKATLKVSL
jgi:acid stress-induced BolA-like protein IbaG/YrbA